MIPSSSFRAQAVQKFEQANMEQSCETITEVEALLDIASKANLCILSVDSALVTVQTWGHECGFPYQADST